MSWANARSECLVVSFVAVATAVVFLRPAAEPFGLPKATLVWLSAAALLAMELARWARGQKPTPAPNRLLIAVGVFVGAFVIVTVASTSPALSVFGEYRYYEGLLSYLSYAVVATVIATRFGPAQLGLVAASVTFGLAGATLYGLVQLVGLDPFDWSTRELPGIFSTLGQPNHAGAYLGATVPLTVGLLVSRVGSGRLRTLLGVVAFLGALVAVSTQAFQGVIGLIVGVLAVLLYHYAREHRARWRERISRLRALEAGVAASVVAALIVLSQQLSRQVSSGLDERVLMWRGALRMFRERPLVGFGPDTFGLHFYAFRPAEHAERLGFTNPEVPHSVPLSMLTSGGIVLAAAYAAVVVLTAAMLLSGLRRLPTGRQRDLLVAFGGMWLAYQVVSLVAIDVPSFAVLHWIAVGAIAVLAPAASPRPDPGRQRKRSRAAPLVPVPLAAAAALVLMLAATVSLTRPLRADLAATRAFELAEAGQGRQSLDEIGRATDLAPYRATYWLLESSIRQRGGDDTGARAALDTAAEVDSGNSQLALLSAQYADALGDTAAADMWRREAIARDPRNPAVHDEPLAGG